MSATDGFEADIINYFLRNQAVTQPTAVYLALSSTVPNENGTNWTELTGNGYARQVLSFGAPSAGTGATDIDVTFGPATADWTAYVALGLFFVSSGGSLKAFKETASKVVPSGASLVFLDGELTVTVN